MNKGWMLITMIFLVACAATKLVTPTQKDVERMSGKFPGYTLAELNNGKALFEQKCTQCHRLKNPASKTEEQWKKIVPTMANKANSNQHKSSIDDKTQEIILKYLITMSAGGK